MIRLSLQVTAATLILLAAILFWGVKLGLAAQPCHGIWLTASWYGPESGNRTATGDKFNGTSLTAAMPSPAHLGEHWRITYRGRSVTVLVNDIGPARYLHRGMDLSKRAASVIGLLPVGVGKICAERLS